jgi:glycosyltransferase involved in cell wall biosynthesis
MTTSEPLILLIEDETPVHRFLGASLPAHGFRLLGAQTDVRSLLRKAHVGVLSSIGEGLPLSVLEYLAEGLPVVMTDVGQAPALVQGAKAGVVVPTRDPEALAEAVAGLLADADRRRTMGENGRRLVAAEYSVDAMVDRVAALYEERLRARGARTHGKG